MAQRYEDFINLGGERSLYARMIGVGPPVVLCSGLGRQGVGAWSMVEDALAGFATVISYDRAGLGRSDALPTPPSAAEMTADLHRVLVALGISRNVLLLGWSFSALLVQMYALQYPSVVSSLLLLDPTPDEIFRSYSGQTRSVQATMRTAMQQALSNSMDDAALREFEGFLESAGDFGQALDRNGGYPDVPMVVITAGKPALYNGRPLKQGMEDSHKRLVQRYSQGRQIIAEKSTHHTMLTDEPELIVDTARMLLDVAASK